MDAWYWWLWLFVAFLPLIGWFFFYWFPRWIYDGVIDRPTKEQKLNLKLAEKKRIAQEALQNLELEHKQWLDAKRESHRLEHREWTQQFYDGMPYSQINVVELEHRPPEFQQWIVNEVKAGRAFLTVNEITHGASHVKYKETKRYE